MGLELRKDGQCGRSFVCAGSPAPREGEGVPCARLLQRGRSVKEQVKRGNFGQIM